MRSWITAYQSETVDSRVTRFVGTHCSVISKSLRDGVSGILDVAFSVEF